MENENIVVTKSGKIRGYLENNGVISFKGIPFAKAPIGNLRFKSPVPIDPWDVVLDAKKFGPICPQPPSMEVLTAGEPLEQNEDNCLSLNIWTPAIDGKKRPVMLWIHGGALETGSSAGYFGEVLAKRGNVVIITINYRLGLFGFLYIKGKTANVGMLDQVLALKWLEDNIEHFGGDPQEITVFGESAGGLSISTLMAMPSAKGLFKRAIIESNVANSYGLKVEGGEKLAAKFFSLLGIENGNIDKLMDISSKEILDASVKAKENFEFGEIYPPYIDGEILPEHPLVAIRQGYAAEIEVLAGTNENEWKLFTLLDPSSNKMDDEMLNQVIEGFLKSLGKGALNTEKFIELYRNIENGKFKYNNKEIMSEFLTDTTFRIPVTRFVEEQSRHQSNVYLYMFCWKSPALGGNLGAFHALEIPFVWNMLPEEDMGIFPKRSEETEYLSTRMMDCWINFARSGNPNHDGIPNWPKYETEKRSVIIFDKDIKTANDPKSDTRKIWGQLI